MTRESQIQQETNVDSSSNMFGENLVNRNQQINTDEEKVKKATLFKTVMPWDLKVALFFDL